MSWTKAGNEFFHRLRPCSLIGKGDGAEQCYGRRRLQVDTSVLACELVASGTGSAVLIERFASNTRLNLELCQVFVDFRERILVYTLGDLFKL